MLDVAVGGSSQGEPKKKTVILTAAQEMKKRKLDERKAMIEAKRMKVSEPSRLLNDRGLIMLGVDVWRQGRYREEAPGAARSRSRETDEGGRNKSRV